MSKEMGIIQQLEEYSSEKVEFGYCKTKLFGDSQITKDSSRIYREKQEE